MSTAEWALMISLGGIVISLGNLVWNIWSKFITPRGKLRVSLYVGNLVTDGTLSEPFLTVRAVNVGAAPLVVSSVAFRKSWHRFRKWPLGLVHVAPHPNFAVAEPVKAILSAMPKKLDVGDAAAFYIPLDCDGLADLQFVDIGIFDSLGVYHRAPRKELKAARKRVNDETGGDK